MRSRINSRIGEPARRALLLLLALALTSSWIPAPRAQAQEEDVVSGLMERMSPAAKVGQLFVVTFPGPELGEDAAIVDLIRDYHVGGVVLDPQNGNIDNSGDTPNQVATLVSQLQETAWQATEAVTDTVGEPFVPLFIAASHEGNGPPYTDITRGTTALPSQMALGATWNLSHTTTVGQIAGRELAALGINMLLGPSLDVLETPRPASSGDLGLRSFGGEPFWVGQMGKAYIRGVHEGAEGRIAVIAKHFPGLGSSDRSLDEEISTVQRTLEKLKQVDLAPFFAVAQTQDVRARADGVMVSHIRFQGLGGGRFITTLPISVDSNVLQQLLNLPEMTAWRESGGVTLSDELGLRALRRFYAPGEQAFNGRRIAQDAFLAGNDLLYLSQFGLSDDWGDQVANVESTITFFRERYETDASFQQQVDEAVARILRLKLSLYGGAFSLESVSPELDAAGATLQSGAETVSAIARDAVTLLSPPSPDLAPAPPTREDRLVIFTDAREVVPCAGCDPVPQIPPQALQETMIQFYGPDATGQIAPELVTSFTFEQLDGYLDAPPAPPPSPTPVAEAGEPVTATATPAPLTVGQALMRADWVIFGMLDVGHGPSEADVVKRFLAEQADVLQDPHVVVMAYDVPYCLDATEISKLSAYYAAYSHQTPFVVASVRALFGEFAPRGAPPVTVSGINYDLRLQTSPDPEQTIAVSYSVVRPPTEEGTATPSVQEPTIEPTEETEPGAEPTGQAEATPETRVERGDQLRLRTDEIFDHNGHVVPDGTPVQFIFTYPQEGLEQSMLATTQEGVAEASLTLDRTGRLDVSVQADPVPRAVALQVTIQEGGSATIVTPTPSPTPEPTATPTPTETPTPTLAPEGTQTLLPIAAATAGPGVEQPESPATPDVKVWNFLLALIGAVVVGGSSYYAMRVGNRPITRALRVALWCVVGGLGIYLIYVMGLSYFGLFNGHGEVWMAGVIALIGSFLAFLLAWLADHRRWSRSGQP